MTDADLLPLNLRAAQQLLDAVPNPQQPFLCADAVWSLPQTPPLRFWQRRSSKTDFSVWDGGFAGALLGLPRSRDELVMNLHLVAARLQPGAPLVLFGRKDAGIAAAERALAAIFNQVTLAQTKFHGRILLATAPQRDPLLEQIDDWRRAHQINLLGKDISLVSYPGLFAGGALDAGTALLLRLLPQVAKAPKMLLDYACGTGLLGIAARQLWPETKIHALDHDALALRAAALNLPQAELVQAESLAACSARYDVILSNPPIHDGARQDYGVVQQLVTMAPDYLARGGQLIMVTQQTVPVQRWAKQAMPLLQEDGYKVWSVKAG